MTNWHNPSLVLAEFGPSPSSQGNSNNLDSLTVALEKLIHVLSGIWEFVQTLQYEYSILTGRRKATWTSPALGRWSTLLLIIIEFLELDSSYSLNCQAVVTTTFTFGTLSLLSTSTLVTLRAFALWEQNRVVIAIGSALWLVNASSYLYSIITFRGHQVDAFCLFVHTSHASILVLSTFITDFVLLVLMLAGVMRWYSIRGRSGVLQLLYSQASSHPPANSYAGLIWVALFTLSGLPSVVFIVLNLNDAMNMMFVAPEIMTMTICGSRMYLGLIKATERSIPPVGTAGSKQQPATSNSETRVQFPGPQQRSYLTEGAAL
ncbi:hypothetical protein BC827DRAFT_1263031 [Russula dissimulans]|nr:hypothetical protein BC827DRAFT_1263031 [Russula dissimulans]